MRLRFEILLSARMSANQFSMDLRVRSQGFVNILSMG